tara:strand:+ start:5372 stop:6400 length:1029 start_codon:yes stop_codon:yes gene_type:complete
LKKVLILGGAGFIGLGIAELLGKKKKYEITIADIYLSDTDVDFQKIINNYNIKYIRSDFTKLESFEKLDQNYDYVYMLASVVGVNRCIEEPDEVIRINTSLIQNTLQWILNCNIGKVIFSSSSECYAATTDLFDYAVPTSENVPLTISEIGHPRFTYAITKMLGESAFLNYGKKFNFPITIVRYQNIFGPRMGFKHVIPHLVERFYQNEDPFVIYGPEQTRAFCYISDAAHGTILAMEAKNADQQIYHIGSPDEITIKKLVETVGEIMGYKGKYISDQSYPGSVNRRCPDISKSKKHLGYFPKVHWNIGLEKTVFWYKNYFSSGKLIENGGFKSPDELNYNL